MKTKLFLIAVLIIVLPTPLFAEPSPAITYLMNEPATLFDIGMYNLNLYLQSNPNFINLSSFARYDWNSNKLIISISDRVGGDKKDKTETQERIIMLVRELRQSFGIITSTGKQSSFYSLYDKFFSHFDYQKKNEPKNIKDVLSNITEIEFSFFYTYKNDKNYGKLEGRAALLGTDIFYKDE